MRGYVHFWEIEKPFRGGDVMSGDIAIKIEDIHKKFRVYFDKGQTAKERVLFRNGNYHEDRWVLKGISFEVNKGKAIGIIGQNGCGKSTLLKLMAKIIYPDKGTIKMNGRVSSLIELGAGFHPDMSGKENIYTNASIFGLTRGEIDKRFKSIIDFSELHDYIDNPVRTYSSGMYMRLAFSVAINVDADILLIDEILSVGDVSFQAKCFNRLREIKASGTTIVIVSHGLSDIEKLCEKSYWVKDGMIGAEGVPNSVHPIYMDFMSGGNELGKKQLADEGFEVKDQILGKNDENRWGNRDVEIKNVEITGPRGKQSSFKSGEMLKISIHYEVNKNVSSPVIGIGIFRNDGIYCYGTNTLTDRIDIVLKQRGIVEFIIPQNDLLEGQYILDVAIHAKDGFAYDYIKGIEKFVVHSPISDAGITRLNHEWIII
jgi:ABC-2 type transport system ATP-binding protein